MRILELEKLLIIDEVHREEGLSLSRIGKMKDFN